MNDYTKPLLDSPDFENPDYIRGMKEGMDACQEISNNEDMKLAENLSFDELYRLVSDKWITFQKK